MIKQAIICVPIILLGAAPPVPQGRAFDGNGASVGPIRAAYRCEPACQRDPILMPPALPPVRSFGVEHHGFAPQPTPVPEPSALAVFAAGVVGLLLVKSRAAPGSRSNANRSNRV